MVRFGRDIGWCFGLAAPAFGSLSEGGVKHCQLQACIASCRLVVCQPSLVCELFFFLGIPYNLKFLARFEKRNLVVFWTGDIGVLEAYAEGDIRHLGIQKGHWRVFCLNFWHVLGTKLGCVLDWRHRRFGSLCKR